MNRYLVSLGIIVALVAGLVMVPSASWAQKPEEIEKVQAAAPAAASVQPKAPRKMLVFNLCKGFVHSAIPLGAKTLEILGQKTGAFEVVSSDDIAVFEADSLAQFDAVCFNNTTGELFLPKDLDKLPEAEQQAAKELDAKLKKNLMDFVKSGKGIVGIHAATDCFYNWAEYGEMMGGYFHGHPWNEKVGVKLDDPGHPINKAFGGKPFEIADEIYQFKDPYSRDNLHLLLSLDITKTNMDKGDAIHRTDGDFAVAWVRNYGKGRVFYCSLGHREAIFWNPAILQHYLDGIQFALGDLEADATPSAAEAQANTEAALKEVATYEFGKSRLSLTVVADAVRDSQDNPEKRAALVTALTNILKGECTRDGKDFVCRQLAVAGTEDTVPALAGLLTKEETSDMARYALERMPYASVDNALLDALGATEGKVRVGIVNSLGERQCAEAVAKLTPLMTGDCPVTAQAAMAALAKIGTPEAVKALAGVKGKVPADLNGAFCDAYLLCADKLAAAGKTDEAIAIFNTMLGAGQAREVRTAAFVGKVSALGESASHVIAETLVGDDADLAAAAAKCTRQIQGTAATQIFVEQLAKMPPAGQVMLISALADRGDDSALPAVAQAAKSDDVSVRLMALEALGKLGDPSAIELLATSAVTDDRTQRDIARNSLDTLKGEDIDAAMLAFMKQCDPKAKAEVVRSLAARGSVSAVPDLLAVATDGDADVRGEAFKALSSLASPDQMTALVDLLLGEEDGRARREAEKAIVAVAKRIPEEDQRGAVVLDKMSDAKGEEAKASMFAVLGEIADPNALKPLLKAAKGGKGLVQDAAVRAVADWPTHAVLDDLVDIAKGADDETHRVLALRGLTRLLELKGAGGLETILGYYQKAMDLAKAPDEQKIVLGSVAKVKSPAAVSIVAPCVDVDELKGEAMLAVTGMLAGAVKLSASAKTEDAKNALDGNMDTRWGTGAPQKGGESFVMDLGAPYEVSALALDVTPNGGDCPRQYQVFVSKDGKDWGDPVAEGKGIGPVTNIAFAPAAGQFVKIAQTGSDEKCWWSIYEIRLLAKPAK